MAAAAGPVQPNQPIQQPDPQGAPAQPPGETGQKLITRLFQAAVVRGGGEAHISSFALHNESATFIVTIGTKAYRITTGDKETIQGIGNANQAAVEKWASAVTQILGELSKKESEGIKSITFVPGDLNAVQNEGYIKIDNKEFKISEIPSITNKYNLALANKQTAGDEITALEAEQRGRTEKLRELDDKINAHPKPDKAVKQQAEAEKAMLQREYVEASKTIAARKKDIIELDKEIHLVHIAQIILGLFGGLNLAGRATLIQPVPARQAAAAPAGGAPPAPAPAPAVQPAPAAQPAIPPGRLDQDLPAPPAPPPAPQPPPAAPPPAPQPPPAAPPPPQQQAAVGPAQQPNRAPGQQAAEREYRSIENPVGPQGQQRPEN
jgi:hypothetical protein